VPENEREVLRLERRLEAGVGDVRWTRGHTNRCSHAHRPPVKSGLVAGQSDRQHGSASCDCLCPPCSQRWGTLNTLLATDWTKVIAEATIALAVVTGVLALAAIFAAWFAWRGLRAAAVDLRATQEMSQRQIDATRRPLLIKVPPAGQIDANETLLEGPDVNGPLVRLAFPGGHIGIVDPRKSYVHVAEDQDKNKPRINIAIPLRNVGNGLAMIQPWLIVVQGPCIAETGGAGTVRPSVPPGETTRIFCAPRLFNDQTPNYPWSLTVTVPYTDFAGRQNTYAKIHLIKLDQDISWTLSEIEQKLQDEFTTGLSEQGRR
jgi:hypothetical protein